MEKTNTEKQIEKDMRIMRVLKVSELRYPVAQTNLGPIELLIRKDETKYTVLLDSTPLEAEQKEQMERYLGLV